MRAVTGPAAKAGQSLRLLPSSMITADANECGYVGDVVGGEHIRLYPTAADSSARVVTAHGDAVPVAYIYARALAAVATTLAALGLVSAAVVGAARRA
jgi:hypothetical protein